MMPSATTWNGRIGATVASTVLAAVMLLSGCADSADDPPGSSVTSSSAASTTQTPSAVAYAACMRDNGVPGFPDPNSKGELAVDLNELGVAPDSEVYQQAEKTCKPLLPLRSPAQRQQDYQAMLKYAACMRNHGLPDFPDPPAPGAGPNVQDNSNASPNSGNGPDPNSARFQSAHQTCQHLLPEGAAGPALNGTP